VFYRAKQSREVVGRRRKKTTASFPIDRHKWRKEVNPFISVVVVGQLEGGEEKECNTGEMRGERKTLLGSSLSCVYLTTTNTPSSLDTSSSN